MVLNSWKKVFDELPNEYQNDPGDTLTDDQLTNAQSFEHNEFDNTPVSIISEFFDLSTSSDKLFEDISLKKIKKMASDKVEKEVIGFVLDKVGWNRSKAAKILKISYKTLLYKMTEFEVQPPVKQFLPFVIIPLLIPYFYIQMKLAVCFRSVLNDAFKS